MSEGARELFLRREDARRDALAGAASLGLFLLAVAAAWLAGLWRGPELDKLPSPVYVSLGAPGRSGGEPPRGPDRPEGAPPAAAVPKTPAPSPASSSKLVGEAPAQVPAAAAPVAPSRPAAPSAAPGPASPAAAEQARPPTPSPATTAPAAPAQAEPALGPLASGPPARPNLVFTSSEKGNTAATTIGAKAGSAGRNLYVEIYLYLPPPLQVEEAILGRIEATKFSTIEARRDFFLRYYQRSEGVWKLKTSVPLAERAELWLLLEAAGYDAAKADFKAMRNLGPVTLRFTIAPAAPGRKPRLDTLELVQSSGYADIDEAVMYGFRQSAYFNSTTETVTGSFTYRFD